MGRRFASACALIAVLGLVATACSKSKTPTAATSSSPAASPSATETAAAVPTATTITLPVTYGFYDGHVDTMLSTDVSDKAQAKAVHINYSAAMITQAASKYPSLYRVAGTAVAGQPQVFGSEPGKPDYSPLWQEVTVRWKSGVKPVLLMKDDQIKALAGQGKLTMTPTPIVLNCPIVKVSSSSTVPTATTVTVPVTYGYYDGHVDTMISTDVSNKAQATSLHINYSAAMLTQAANKYPALYQVSGTAAPNQPQVFGSQPGEDDYSPLWQEITVTWKAGVTPVLLIKDDQVKELASKGMLTLTPTSIVLNCPIVKVG
ncbi:MAG TPA: hypothetical protein VKV69_05800 [Actinomycetota bacterium]|nr:hypothetical protein [Actinomycetota bacterium]